jgi:hypothetical protein
MEQHVIQSPIFSDVLFLLGSSAIPLRSDSKQGVLSTFLLLLILALCPKI